MSDADNLIPFLQQLVQRLRITPPESEIALLQKATFKEMRPYFDALASGRTDAEVYQMILKYLANPSTGTGLNAAPAPASPPKAAPAQAAPAPEVKSPRRPQNDPNRQIRKIADGVELHVIESPGPTFAFELLTKGTADLTTLSMDFSGSMNIALKPEGPSKSTGVLSFTVNIPTTANTGGKELSALIATASGTSGNVSLNYKVGIKSGSAPAGAASPPTASAPREAPANTTGAGSEPDDVTTVADGLTVIVRSVDTGYKLLGSNTHPTNTYTVTIDLGESSNLTFSAQGLGKLTDAAKVSFSIGPNAGQVLVVDCNVKDYGAGSCDIRYKVTARVGA